MSSDSDGAKYQADSRYLSGNLVMSDHAIDRFQERAPRGSLTYQQAYRRGEFVGHPSVAHASKPEEVPEAARVYVNRDGWGVVFLVNNSETGPYDEDAYAEFVVPTVLRIRDYNNEPSRAYFRAHGPHDPEVVK